MDLQELVFRARTDELLKAKTAIDDLAKSVNNLNTVVDKEAKTQSAANKPKQESAKANNDVAESTAKSTTALERQQKILEYMTQGFSKGQASILATASAANTATDDLKKLGEVLQTQRKLIGGDPFDKSMSGLVALTNQYGEIREAIRQYNSDTGLTRSQTRELARDKERIIEKMKLEGASFSQIKTAIRDYNASYVEAATKVNSLTKVEKDRERTMRDTANATRNVQAAEERLFATVAHLNEGLSQNSSVNERAALAIGAYERNLRLAGITGEQAAMKMQKFIAAQKQVSDAEAKNRASYVSRGIGVQMGDVAVSLASGMNPLTVAIQQGDQIRGLLQQSGLEAAQMGKVMQQAVAGIAASFKDVGIAVGSFALGGIKSLGSGITELASKLTGIRALSKSYAEDMLAMGPPTAQVASNISKLSIIATASGLAIGGLLTFILALTAGFYKAIKESDNLAASLAVNSEKILLTHNSAMRLVEGMREIGVTSAKSTEALTAMAETGGFVKNEFELVIKSAADLQTYAGVSISETVKKFAELKKDPVEAVKTLAGVISSETAQTILNLVEQGKTLEAQELVMKAYSGVVQEEIKRMKEDYSGLTLFVKELGKGISEYFDKIFKSFDQSGIDAQISHIQALLDQSKGGMVLSSLQQWGKGREDLENELIRLQNLKKAQDDKNASDERTLALNKLKEEAFQLRKKSMSEEEKYLINTTILQNKASKAREAGDEQTAKAFEDAQQREAEAYVKAAKSSLEYKADHEALTAAKKAGKEINDYYIRTLEKIDNLNIKNTQSTLEQTKSEQLLIGLYNDPTWSKLSVRLQEEIKSRIEKAKAIEIENKAFENQKKLQEEFNKVNEDYKAKGVADLAEINNKTTLLKMTEEERVISEAVLKVEKERQATLEKINQIAANKARTGMDILDVEAERVKATAEANKFYDEQNSNVEQATIKQQEYARSFTAGWDKAFNEYTAAARNSASLGENLFKKMADGMTDAIVEFAMTGKLSIQDFARTFLAEMLKMQVRAAATSIMGNSSGGFGSLLSSILGGGTQAPAPVSTPTMQTSGPEIYQIPGMGSWDMGGYTGNGGKNEPAGIVHKGEIVWSQSDIANAGGIGVVEAMRKGLGGYSNGGVVGSPASSSSGSHKNNGELSVEINNYNGTAGVTAEQVTDSRGNRKVNIVISEIAGNEVRRSGSPLNNSLRNNFGLTPALNGR